MVEVVIGLGPLRDAPADEGAPAHPDKDAVIDKASNHSSAEPKRGARSALRHHARAAVTGLHTATSLARRPSARLRNPQPSLIFGLATSAHGVSRNTPLFVVAKTKISWGGGTSCTIP
jgi:hypothetical protein